MFHLILQAEAGGVPLYVIGLAVVALAIIGFVVYKKNIAEQPDSDAHPGVLRVNETAVPRVRPNNPAPNNAFEAAPKGNDLQSSASVPKSNKVSSQNAALAARQNIKQSIASGAKLTVETDAPSASIPVSPVASSNERDTFASDVIHEAEVLRGNGRRDLAAKKLREFVSKNPQNAGVLELLGDVLAESEDLSAAAEAYRQSAKINPQSARVCTSLAKTLEQIGDIPGAISAYRAATVADPTDHKAYNNLGGLLAETGDMNGGVEAFRKALAIQPDNEAAKENLALAEELLREQTATR